MRLSALIFSEIARHKAGFAAGVAAIAVATGTLTAVVCLLSAHDARTRAVLSEKEEMTREKMALMARDIEQAMERLGFNMIILPENQETGNWYADSYAEKTMPEEYSRKLFAAQIPAIGDILAVLRRKMEWPETNWSVILAGKVSLNKSNLAESGQVQLGHEIHQGLKLKEGDSIKIKGREFEVADCLVREGDMSDVTIFMNLEDAQELTDKAGLINEIHVREYQGGWKELAAARDSILEILPGTQIVEKNFEASAKIMAFEKARERSQAAIESDRRHSAESRAVLKKFSILITSAAMLICVVWIALLASRNISSRIGELAILRSVGLGAGKIIILFTGRLFILAMAGGILGYLFGSMACISSYPAGIHILGLAVLTSMLLTFLSSCPPVLLAVKRDPASMFQEAQ